MANPYIGEIRICPYTFAPVGWASCDGQVQSIAQNSTLFNLIGTTYGGDGVQTFNLPNLQSRIPVGTTSGYVIGQSGGVEMVALTASQLPLHSHTASAASATGNSTSPAGNTWAASPLASYSASGSPVLAAMSPSAIASAGSSLPHPNIMPFLAINFIISLFGVYPSQT